jgi:ParB family chromosome partitioning protein
MNSLNFGHILISEIKIGVRLRKELGDIDSLAKSMEDLGLLQPIVVTQDLWLVDGERRLTAAKKLAWTEIPAVVMPFNYSGALA